MSRQITQTRQILAKLFSGERISFTPTRSGYEFSGVAAAVKLLIGHAKALVSPTGFSKGGSDFFTFQIDVRALAA